MKKENEYEEINCNVPFAHGWLSVGWGSRFE